MSSSDSNYTLTILTCGVILGYTLYAYRDRIVPKYIKELLMNNMDITTLPPDVLLHKYLSGTSTKYKNVVKALHNFQLEDLHESSRIGSIDTVIYDTILPEYREGLEVPQRTPISPSNPCLYDFQTTCMKVPEVIDPYIMSLYKECLTLNGTPCASTCDKIEYPILYNTLLRSIHITQLLEQLEQLRSTPYDKTNPLHEALLHTLWVTVYPDSKYERVTDMWGTLGFQGTDPMTDFRGGGVLSLLQLIHVFRKSPELCAKMMENSKREPVAYFGIAITSIYFTVTFLAFFNARTYDKLFLKYPTSLDTYNACIVYLFERLHSLWDEEKRTYEENQKRFPKSYPMKFTIHEFGRILKKLSGQVLDDINNNNINLVIGSTNEKVKSEEVKK